MNLPNTLTMFRFLLVPVFLYALFAGHYKLALVSFVTAGLTDAIDGALARMLGQVTELGVLLDPLADKALVVSAFVALTILNIIPVWLTALIVIRDVVILAGSIILYKRGYRGEIKPSILGKMTTFALLSLMAFSLSELYYGREFLLTHYLVYAAVPLVVASGLQYVLKGYRIIGR